MVSLPRIDQMDCQDIMRCSVLSTTESVTSVSSRISAEVCRACVQDLALSGYRTRPEILQVYREKTEHLHMLKRFFQEQNFRIPQWRLSLEEKFEPFVSDDTSGRSLSITPSELPLLRKSRVMPPKKSLDWKTLNEKIKARCHIVADSTPPTKEIQQKRNVRNLPLLQAKTVKKVAEREKESPEIILISEPTEITFGDFEIGKSYTQKCKIKNISNGKCKFTINCFNSSSPFRIKWNQQINKLAAGMSIVLTVQFDCTSLADVQDKLRVFLERGETLIINIQAKSPPPLLVDYIDTAYNILGKKNSLISCGNNFVGEEGTMVLNLKNVGPAGRFCFLRESDFYSVEFEIDSSNRLILDSFTVEPMYFSLDRTETIEILVSYKTPFAGTQSDLVFLLCSNSSVRQVDLVNNGFLYDLHWIQVMGLLKTFDADIQDDYSADSYINFGQMLSRMRRYHNFSLFNSGYVHMKYHWEVRPAILRDRNRKLLPSEALTISPAQGQLYYQILGCCQVQCDTSSVPPGRYCLIMVLFVDDLPIKSVPLDLHDKLLPCRTDPNLWSIEAQSVEVWVDVVEPKLTLRPYIVDFSDFPLICGSSVETQNIIIENLCVGDLQLTWVYQDVGPCVKLSIEPQQFCIKKFSSTACILSIEPVEEGDFSTNIRCVADDEEIQIKLEIKGVCCRREIQTITNSVDFGLVKRGSRQTKEIIAKNCYSVERRTWTLNELLFEQFDDGHLDEMNMLGSLSAYQVDFCHKDSEILVNYTLNTQSDKLWCSVVEWEGRYVPVLADVQEPDVSLSSHLVTVDLMYTDVRYDVSLTVDNHTLNNTAVFWGNPLIPMGDRQVVEVEPRFAVLQPSEKLITQIHLTSNVVGFLDNLYIPCFVEGYIQPLILKIEGFVEGLTVRVEWDSGDGHQCVFWPSTKCKEIVKYSHFFHSPIFLCPTDSSTRTSNELECGPLDEHNDLKFEHNDATSDVRSEVSHESSIPYLNWPIIGGRYTREPMSDEMERHFNGLLSSVEYEEVDEDKDISNFPANTLCFRDVPFKEAVTHVVYIKNDSDICSHFEACVANNYERPQQPVEMSVPEKIERKLKCAEEDGWSKRASKDRGLTVFVEPACGQLLPQDYVILHVTVYANSWGQYSDVLLLQLGDLELLTLNLRVMVHQPPVLAPHLLRFGAVQHSSPPQLRYLKVENRSTVPVYVLWQVFIPSPDSLPFGVMLSDDSPFELKLTPHYGSFVSPFFEVPEKYTELEPCSSKNVAVLFNPKDCGIEVNDKILTEIQTAILLGYVFLTDQARFITNSEICVRDDGIKLGPLKIDLEAFVEVPVLTLLNVYNYHLLFKCTANSVMSTEEKVWRKESVITVKNNSYTKIKANIVTVGYFYVSKINYLCSELNNSSKTDSITLDSGEICEVTVTCEVSQDTLYECFDVEPVILADTEIESGIVEMGVVSFQQEELKQDVRLELWLYQPLIYISVSSLNFGLVYVEETKVIVITLMAPIGKEYFEISIKSERNNEVFSVNKKSGVLMPKVGLPLEVSFTPKISITYAELLVIRSCMSKSFWEIPLYGVGTFNYRAHIY